MFDLIEAENNLLLIGKNSKSIRRLCETLEAQYNCETIASCAAAKTRMRAKNYAIILFNGCKSLARTLNLIAQVRRDSPLSLVILVSEEKSSNFAVQAFRAGAFDVLQTPLEFELITASVARAVEHYGLRRLKDQYQFHLEQLVADRTTEVHEALEEVEKSYRITLKALVQALETRDFETHGHSERVVTFSLRLGHELGLGKNELRDLELGALLHDIGKIGVPDAILRKPAQLNGEEWQEMKLHPLHGQKILRNIEFLENAAQLVAQHHEKWDGSGYPYGLRGENIDLGARIFAVVDAFDAMISDRVYRHGRPYEKALAEIERCAGTQFDPAIVAAFKQIPSEDWDVLRQRSLRSKPENVSFQAVVSELVYSRQQLEMVH